ncbi:hypothetical protein TIFTF001_028713 [Ficus carica]|uniref:Uncharacterized protein n=1 Tax=Ficus carica TaxID=3494 RepID=A0AA88DS36_FICCA|nr:hypothetical protein TIFTF001_028713 [Ficus carica]
MRMTDHSGMGDALWFEVGEDLGRFFIHELDDFNDFPWGVLSWEATRVAYESLPLIAAKFTTKYDEAIMRMLSWTTVDNVKFNDVISAFTAVGEK